MLQNNAYPFWKLKDVLLLFMKAHCGQDLILFSLKKKGRMKAEMILKKENKKEIENKKIKVVQVLQTLLSVW